VFVDVITKESHTEDISKVFDSEHV